MHLAILSESVLLPVGAEAIVMRPLTVITGIIFGSCASVAISLMAVLLIFLILGDDYPRLQYEFRGLVSSLLIFLAMTAITAWSFYSMVTNHKSRKFAQAAMWLGLSVVVFYYWP
ncbi:hypothetical protein BA177_10355 [Woeseia oceani]|uniref:Uncharacterized protein n=2 Tax=Woeseia oceani TaxID=1548547 RepID=A0A193LGG7_9GAMM|nr:hypothetical protein BA177_10355 [Woeseia oceani]